MIDWLASNWPWMCACAALFLLWRILTELREIRIEVRLVERQMPESAARRAELARTRDEYGLSDAVQKRGN